MFMAVKPEVQAFLDLLGQLGGPDTSELTPAEARAAYQQLYAMVPKADIADMVDRLVPGPAGDVPVRVYTPATGSAPRPVLVWFNGGGFVIGDLDTTDNTARSLANRAGAIVVSVDYRLAPEHPFPAAVDDAVEVTRWVAQHAEELGGDASRLAVGGHSAGANLAAVVCQLAKAIGGPAIALQVLCCPATDASTTRPSMDQNGTGYFLTRATMQWFIDTYVGANGAAVSNPRVSPLLAAQLAGLPPAVVITAEHDPLRDEGEAYADALRDAGVHVDHRCYDGEIHDFYTLEGILPDADDALDHLGTAITESLR
jgi:acetyl esterase